MEQHRPGRVRVTRWAWALIGTIPVGGAAAAFCLFFAGIAVCGVSGCSGGGFGTSYGADIEWIIPSVLAGVCVTLALAAPPWLLPHKLRWLVAGAIGAVLAAVVIIGLYDAKYPLVD